MPHPKPLLSFWQIWNMCFGFLGLQFGFALQNANVSWIFQSLGAATSSCTRARSWACRRPRSPPPPGSWRPIESIGGSTQWTLPPLSALIAERA